MVDLRRFSIEPLGPFSLEEAALFGFGQRTEARFDGVLRLAFCLDGDGYRRQIGVEVRQDKRGVHCISYGGGEAATVLAQVARVLSLDFDGNVFTAVGDRDPVVARLQAAAPGLRPPLFYSPYEAAVWVVLSSRRPRQQMAAVRRAISEAHGKVFDLAGERLACLPTPEQLLAIDEVPGLDPEKVARIHGVARAALYGALDVDRLKALGPEAAVEDLQSLRGIGKFYASLIAIRACGFADVLPIEERHLLDLVASLYGLESPPTHSELRAIAEPWRPMRTWVSVLLRAAGPRVLAAPGQDAEPDPMLGGRRPSVGPSPRC